MKHQLDLRYQWTGQPVQHADQLMLMGSCFTIHIGTALAERGFRTLSNPTGILFDPTAVARHLHDIQRNRRYTAADFFEHNECWNHWDFHSDFSHTQLEQAVQELNAAILTAHTFVQQASWLVITLGSAFRYVRRDDGRPVANNHRAPADGFEKQLLSVEEITAALSEAVLALRTTNPGLQLLLTVSPVRHIRDGVVENNRSKARLLEAVHQLCERLPHTYYFPAYELVIDVLRDHRWYDIDLVHPNFAATSYVFEQFSLLCMTENTRKRCEEVYQLTLARRHRPRFPDTEAHRKFEAETLKKLTQLKQQLPWL